MTMKEEAVAIRDRIYKTLPESIKQEFGEDVWAAAVYGSESFWNVQDLSSDESYVDDIIDMYREGRTVTYMYYNLGKLLPREDIIQVLHNHHVPMPEYDMMNKELLEKLFHGDDITGVPGAQLKEAENLRSTYGWAESKSIPLEDEITEYEGEIDTINAMLGAGYNAVDVACHSGRQLWQIRELLPNNNTMESGVIMRYWSAGRSIRAISVLTKKSREDVIKLLRSMNCALLRTFDDYNVFAVNEAVSDIRPGALTKLTTDKLPKQHIHVELPTEETVKILLPHVGEDKVKGLSVLLGVPHTVAENLLSMYQ